MYSTPTIDQKASIDARVSLSIDFWPGVSQVRLKSGNIYIYQQTFSAAGHQCQRLFFTKQYKHTITVTITELNVEHS